MLRYCVLYFTTRTSLSPCNFAYTSDSFRYSHHFDSRFMWIVIISSIYTCRKPPLPCRTPALERRRSPTRQTVQSNILFDGQPCLDARRERLVLGSGGVAGDPVAEPNSPPTKSETPRACGVCRTPNSLTFVEFQIPRGLVPLTNISPQMRELNHTRDASDH